MSQLRRRVASAPRWLWQVGALAAGAVLVWQGRYVVAGLLTAVAIGFAGAVVLVGVWMLWGLARPGRHESAEGPLAAARHLGSQVGRHAVLARRAVGQAPWRGPQQVLNAVAEQVREQVATLPGGIAAVRTVEVRLHPDTISTLDAWMPVEDVAGHWARGYADRHDGVPSASGKVSILVVPDDRAPLNRARVSSTFRDPEHPQAVALASAPLSGPRLHPARNMHTAVRVDKPAATHAAAPPRPAGPPAHDGGALPDPDRTQRVPAGPDADRTQVLTRSAAPRQAAGGPDELLLLPVHPDTGARTGQGPLSLRAPRALVGRSPDQDLSLAGSHVSRRHAEVGRVSSGWVITDQHSTRGTYRNGHLIEPGIPHPLAMGDLLEFGRPGPGGTPTAYRVTDPAAGRAA